MTHVGYHWTKTPSGQYVDGHKRVNVVEYQQTKFLPVFTEMLSHTCIYTREGTECLAVPPLETHQLVIWNHDESTYYTNDQRKIRWVHKSETTLPYAKGEGPSIMITVL